MSQNKIEKTPELHIKGEIELDDFTLKVHQVIPAEGITGVFGHSGSGKSTLLRLIAGLNRLSSGHIMLNDKLLFDANKKLNIKPEKRRIGLVFQDSRLFPHCTVLQNLQYAHKRCVNKKLNLNDIVALTQLERLLPKQVTLLSGGEKQRVALARAILSEPELLLLDEPLSALDKNNKQRMLTLLLNVQSKLNIPMLYVSHSLQELQQIADNLLVLNKGKVAHFGAIHQVIHTLNNSQLTLQQTSLSLLLKQHLPQYGLSVLHLTDESCIYLPLQDKPSKNDPISDNIAEEKKGLSEEFASKKYIRCFIAANDVSISRSEAKDSSIVNQFQAKIVAIQAQQNTVLISLHYQRHIFYSAISLWSAERLSLNINDHVYIQFKASAVRSYINNGAF